MTLHSCVKTSSCFSDAATVLVNKNAAFNDAVDVLHTWIFFFSSCLKKCFNIYPLLLGWREWSVAGRSLFRLSGYTDSDSFPNTFAPNYVLVLIPLDNNISNYTLNWITNFLYICQCIKIHKYNGQMPKSFPKKINMADTWQKNYA